jgi:hypothetical protein
METMAAPSDAAGAAALISAAADGGAPIRIYQKREDLDAMNMSREERAHLIQVRDCGRDTETIAPSFPPFPVVS